MARKKTDPAPEQEVLDAPAAAPIAEYNAVDAGLAELRNKVASTVYDITTTAGDKTARALRLECVTLRSSVEARRKEVKAPLLAKERALDAEAARITAEIQKIETPLDAAIKAEEKRKADEKAARERAEAEARRKIDQAISDISYVPVYASGKPSAKIDELRTELRARELTEEEFGARIGEAGMARSAALVKLDAMHDAAVAQETEAERLAAERADLERQRQELADQRAQQRQDAIGETLDAGTKATMAPLPEPDYEAAEREHMGDADAGTGISSGQRAALQIIGQQESPGGGSGARGTFLIPDDSPAWAGIAPDLAEAADNTAPGAAELIEVIADYYDVPPFTAEAWLRAAFGAKQ